jgi:tetratricopeptide (TPR) repeat protein
VETESWPRAAEFFPPAAPAAPASSAEHMHGGAAPAANYSQTEVYGAFVRGMAAAKRGSADAEKEIAYLQSVQEQRAKSSDAYNARHVEVLALSVSAQLHAARGKWEEAITQMKRATTLEEEMSPPSGPPDLIKPSHELFGEILLKAGKGAEAQAMFEVALQRQPNRARALLGAARAANAAGRNEVARNYYDKLAGIWKGADKDLAELREVQDALKKAPVRAGAEE